MSPAKLYDILVLGAGPAGAAASLFAARKGLSTAVVDRRDRPPDGPHVEWLHPNAHKLLATHGVASHGAVLGTIGRVRFVDARCEQQARTTIDEGINAVDTVRLTQAVLSGAIDASADVFTGVEVTAIDVQERSVCLMTSDDRSFAGRILLAADGCDSLAVRSLGLEPEPDVASKSACCQWTSGSPASDGPTESEVPVELTLILASEDLSSFGYAFDVGGAHIIGLVATMPCGDIGARFEHAVAQWKDAGILSADITPDASRMEVRHVPRGLALDLDTHVAKNGLVIGDAGGYVSAITHEGLYPAIWSASLASDVCARALRSEHTQDALMEFDLLWRREIVEYLRQPNTDLRFLLPLVFSNERMAKRLAQAFLCGANI